MRALLIIAYIFCMQGPEGGENVLIQPLQSLPNLTLQPAVVSLSHIIDVPTSQSINATLLKLIIMQRPKSVQQLLAGMTKVGSQGSFMNKILILYMLGLLMVPIREIENSQEAPQSWKKFRYNFTVSSERKEDECSTFQYRFISSIALTNKQRLLNARKIMQIQFERYGVSYTFRKIEKMAQLRYHQPIVEGGVQLPSFIKLFPQTNDMHLVFHYDETPQKMELKNFLQIITVIGNRKPQYQFEKVLIEVAEGLERQVKWENKRDKYYLGFTFRHLYIIDRVDIDVEIDMTPTSIAEWQKSEALQARSMFLFAMPSKQHENFFMNADRKSIAFIILEILAAKYNIKRFERQRREPIAVAEVGPHLQQFVAFLEEERYINDGVLLRKVKSWLHLAIDEKIDEDWQKDDYGTPIIRNYSLKEIMVQSEDRDKQLLNIFLSEEENLPKSKPSYQPPNITSGQNVQNISINTDLILQQLQSIKKSQELSNYIATKLTEPQMVVLENQILSDTTFFDKIGFNVKQSLHITYTNCPTCDSKSKMIFYNSCHHGQCLYCFSTYIEEEATKYHNFRIKCYYCTSQLDYALIKNILEKDTTLKGLYCRLLLLRYAKQYPIKYTYCQNKECQKVSTLYNNKPLCSFILCQSCKNATCILCSLVCHQPRQCKQYNKEKDDVATKVIVKMDEIRWPDFMQRPKLVKQCERKLEKAGVIEVLNDNQKMVREWLTLFLLLPKLKRGRNRLGLHYDLLQILSQKVGQLLQKIYQHCQNSTQNSMECINLCIQLQKIRSLRPQIIASAYFV